MAARFIWDHFKVFLRCKYDVHCTMLSLDNELKIRKYLHQMQMAGILSELITIVNSKSLKLQCISELLWIRDYAYWHTWDLWTEVGSYVRSYCEISALGRPAINDKVLGVLTKKFNKHRAIELHDYFESMDVLVRRNRM
jgi:hypothetical protein